MIASKFALSLCLLLVFSTAWAQTTTPAVAPRRKTFQHPKGFGFQYPADWRVQDTSEFTQLIPPGLTADDQSENVRVLTELSPVEVTDQRFAA